MKYLLALLFFALIVVARSQGDQTLQKAEVLRTKTANIKDSSVVLALNESARDSLYVNPKTAYKYAKTALDLSTRIEFPSGEIVSLQNLSRAKIYLNDIDSAKYFVNIAIKKAQKIGDQKLLYKSYSLKGTVFFYYGKYDACINYLLKAVKISEKVDPSGSHVIYGNIGLIFQKIGNISKAEEYQRKCLRLSRLYNDSASISNCLNNLGIIAKNKDSLSLALTYYEEGLTIAEVTDNKKSKSEILQNISNVYFKQGKTEQGMAAFEKSIEHSKKNNSYLHLSIDYHNLGYNLCEEKKYSEGKKAFEQAIDYAFKINHYEVITEAYSGVADCDSALGNIRAAYINQKRANEYKDSLNITTINNTMLAAEENYKDEKRALKDSLTNVRQDIENAKNEEFTAQKLRNRDYLLLTAFITLLIAAYGLYLLSKKNKQVKAKNIIVENQHREITDSINYAQRIQNAMISNEDAWHKISPLKFIFFQPKDVVSGDFHWAHFNKEKNIGVWAIADCTGHGVPGAFMSMLGISLLNDIVIEKECLNPAKILDKLREKVIASLSKKGNEQSSDGMDISLCVWNKNDNTLEYAGANNPLWIIRNTPLVIDENFNRVVKSTVKDQSLVEISPDKMPIGIYHGENKHFTTRKIQLFPEDIIISITDGYPDQFGGKRGKKLKYKPFKELLLAIQEKNILDQSNVLEEYLIKWMGEHEQIDDICIVGVKVS